MNEKNRAYYRQEFNIHIDRLSELLSATGKTSSQDWERLSILVEKIEIYRQKFVRGPYLRMTSELAVLAWSFLTVCNEFFIDKSISEDIFKLILTSLYAAYVAFYVFEMEINFRDSMEKISLTDEIHDLLHQLGISSDLWPIDFNKKLKKFIEAYYQLLPFSEFQKYLLDQSGNALEEAMKTEAAFILNQEKPKRKRKS